MTLFHVLSQTVVVLQSLRLRTDIRPQPSVLLDIAEADDPSRLRECFSGPGCRRQRSPVRAEAHDEVLRLAEEQLQVGKRMVETGMTRVRRFVTEKEVSADVTLHEEHAEVLRRAVTDPKYIGDIDWADSTIEIRETAEQALVSKTARVVEEVGLKKIGSDHVETVRDKIRRQQVEIERLGPDGRPLTTAPRA